MLRCVASASAWSLGDASFGRYATHDGPDGLIQSDYNCLSSADMINWRDEGIAFNLNDTTWAKGTQAWAQQVGRSLC